MDSQRYRLRIKLENAPYATGVAHVKGVEGASSEIKNGTADLGFVNYGKTKIIVKVVGYPEKEIDIVAGPNRTPNWVDIELEDPLPLDGSREFLKRESFGNFNLFSITEDEVVSQRLYGPYNEFLGLSKNGAFLRFAGVNAIYMVSKAGERRVEWKSKQELSGLSFNPENNELAFLIEGDLHTVNLKDKKQKRWTHNRSISQPIHWVFNDHIYVSGNQKLILSRDGSEYSFHPYQKSSSPLGVYLFRMDGLLGAKYFERSIFIPEIDHSKRIDLGTRTATILGWTKEKTGIYFLNKKGTKFKKGLYVANKSGDVNYITDYRKGDTYTQVGKDDPALVLRRNGPADEGTFIIKEDSKLLKIDKLSQKTTWVGPKSLIYTITKRDHTETWIYFLDTQKKRKLIESEFGAVLAKDSKAIYLTADKNLYSLTNGQLILVGPAGPLGSISGKIESVSK